MGGHLTVILFMRTDTLQRSDTTKVANGDLSESYVIKVILKWL